MSEPLAQALRISGASMIMLTSIESRTTTWSAGRTRVGSDVAALGAAITEAAAEMVRLTAVGVEMDDLLVTSPANFHVLRVVDGQVAHLVLDRGAANLAMARREFRQLVEDRPALPPPPAELAADAATAVEALAEAGVAVEVGVETGVEAGVGTAVVEAEDPDEAQSVLARAVVPVEAEVVFEPPVIPDQRDDEPYPASEALEGEVLPPSPVGLVPTDSDLPRLPQRRADAGWQDDPTAYQATVPTLPEWLRAAAQGPFTNDSQTLDRVIGGLRRLQ